MSAALRTFIYDDRGQRQPFDPLRAGRRLGGCFLCGSPHIHAVGVFRPVTTADRCAVLKLRRQPVRPLSDPGIVYGLCDQHDLDQIADQVEARVLQLASEVVVQ